MHKRGSRPTSRRTIASGRVIPGMQSILHRFDETDDIRKRGTQLVRDISDELSLADTCISERDRHFVERRRELRELVTTAFTHSCVEGATPDRSRRVRESTYARDQGSGKQERSNRSGERCD